MNATDAIVTHSPIICSVINRYTTGGHPEATPETLQHLERAYILEMLRKGLADAEISERGRLAAEAAIAAIEADAR
jgi:hypothetical protein